MNSFSKRLALACLCLSCLFTTPTLALENADKAAAQAVIESFDTTLLSTMKDAKSLGYQGRFSRLAPVIDKSFDLPLMTKLLVGTAWNDFTPEKQKSLVDQFRRFTIGSYASRFDGYDGEKIAVVGDPMELRDNLRVLTEIQPKATATVKIDYIMDNSTGTWRVMDIFLQGTISEIATQRSEFQSVLSSNGIDGLITTLDKKTADLATGGNGGPPPVRQP